MPYTSAPESIYSQPHRERIAERVYMRDQYENYSQVDLDNMKLYEWLIDYMEPSRIRLVMKDRNDFDPDPEKNNLAYYDSFAYENNDTSKNNILLTTCDVNNSNASAGVFAFMVHDYENNIDLKKVGHNNIVIISCKKLKEDNWQNLMYGICRKDDHTIYGSVGHKILFSGFGTAVIANETILDFRRIATRSSINSINPFRDDPRMYSPQLTKDVFDADDVYPEKITSKNQTLKDRGFFDTSGIDFSIKEFIAGLSAPLVVASRVLNDIASLVGADWYVDEYNIVRHVFLSNRPSGIVFKGVPKYIDNKDRVSYFMNNVEVSRSTYLNEGFANKLWANVSVIDVQKTGGSSEGGSQAMFDIDVAQQLPEGIILKDIALLLQRNGAGTSDPKNITTLHGHIIKDVSNTPTGKIVCHFDIPLQQIPTDRPTAVFIPNLIISPGISIGTTEKLWISLYDRGSNINNTILWFKGKDTAGRVAKREPQDDLASNDGWVVEDGQNTLAFAAFNRSIQRVNASDPYSIRIYGLVEKVVGVPLANDPATVDKYLHQMLMVCAKPKLSFNANTVSIPNELIRPRSMGIFEEPRITFANNKGLLVDINSVDYRFDANEFGLGSRLCTIGLTGLFDYRTHFLKRVSKNFSCTRT